MESEKFERLWQDLKTQRDELNLQMHLAKAELKDEWAELEDKYAVAQRKFDELKKDSGEIASDVKNTLNVLADEMGEAYQRVKVRLKHQ